LNVQPVGLWSKRNGISYKKHGVTRAPVRTPILTLE
jgi:hypothetical protein